MTSPEGVRTRVLDSGDLDGVLALCRAEGWTSYTDDPDRALRALTAPGALTVVAVGDGRVVGFAHVLSDGELHAYLSTMVVDAGWRRRGIGRELLERTLRYSSAGRLDLVSGDDAVGFFDSSAAHRMAGYRFSTEV